MEEIIDELTSHFKRIYDQLHALYEVISYSDMKVGLNIFGRIVACNRGYLFL